MIIIANTNCENHLCAMWEKYHLVIRLNVRHDREDLMELIDDSCVSFGRELNSIRIEVISVGV